MQLIPILLSLLFSSYDSPATENAPEVSEDQVTYATNISFWT